jgi:lipid II:glycine glycyltransferase (peptidoglycan interpeptide bridge formation enzyme)
MAQFRLKRLPFLQAGVAEANWGPLWTPAAGVESLGEFLRHIRREYCERRGLDVRLELPADLGVDGGSQMTETLESCGFRHKPSERAYRTTVLDLSLGLDKLRANLNGKWRNCLNTAEKAGLRAECGVSTEHFDRFLKVYDQMWSQKRFGSGVRMDAIRAFQQTACASCKFLIWILQDHDVDVAAGVFSALGNTMLYFLGATSPSARKGSNPGYLMQWLTLQKAVEMGLRYYDLGGLTDLPESGVDLYKNRMGGSRVVYPGWFQASVSSFSSKIYVGIETSARTVRDWSARIRK